MSEPRYADGSGARIGDHVTYAGKASEGYRTRVGVVTHISAKRISVQWPATPPRQQGMIGHYADGKLAYFFNSDLEKTSRALSPEGGRETTVMETCKTCGGLGRVPPDLQEITLTTQEARLVGGIVANWIGEMGSIFNRPEMRSEENVLRHKFGLGEQK